MPRPTLMPRPPAIGLRSPRRSGRAVPLWGALAATLLAVAFFLILPDWRLQWLVGASGLPQVLPLAQPPLGLTARALLALAAGGLAGAVAWSALFLLFGPGGPFAPRVHGADDVPQVRRADAHPDAPPRRPLSAADLGVPPPPHRDPVERTLPADLEQPLAAFDPTAIPDVPREPVRALAPVARPPGPSTASPAESTGEPPVPAEPARTETIEPTPVAPPPEPAPELPADPPPSIEALLQRLERGTRREGGHRPR